VVSWNIWEEQKQKKLLSHIPISLKNKVNGDFDAKYLLLILLYVGHVGG
jgi:hypothetical protein